MTEPQTIPTPSTVSYLLPPEAYLSGEWYRAEQELLFGRTWHLAGHLSELDTGHIEAVHKRLVVRAGRTRIAVERLEDGRLVAFQNPWLELGGRPVDGDEADLPPARVETWENLVWVNPDLDGPPIEDWVGEFARGIEGYRPGLLELAGRAQIEARFNWKLFIENHIDVLHLWYLHAGTLPSDHQQFEWRNCGPHWVSYEPLKPDADRKPRFTKPISHVEGTRGPLGIGAHLIFPNIVFTTGRDLVNLTTVRPLAPDRCLFDSLTLREPGAEWTKEGQGFRKRIVGSVMDEDLTACEGMQALMRSSRFAVGPLAGRHEEPIMRFHQSLLSYLERAAVLA